MVSGLDTGLILGVNFPSGGARFGRPADEDELQNANAINGSARTQGVSNGLALQPFEEGVDAGEGDEGPFFVSGLNGLLAPPSIAAVQEDRAATGEEEAEDGGGEGFSAEASEISAEGADSEESASGDGSDSANPNELSEEEKEQVEDLKERDAEVRRHEQAHKAVGGQYAGAISYSYESGPDGKRYAVGGEVPIDVSKIPGDPEATIQKLQQVRSAALAPAEPSGADRAVAAKASQGIQEARAEQIQESAEELEELTSGDEEEKSDISVDTDDAAPEQVPENGLQTFELVADNAVSDVAGSDDGAESNSFGIRASNDDRSGTVGESVFDISRGGADREGNERASRYSGYNADGSSPFDLTVGRGSVTLDIAV